MKWLRVTLSLTIVAIVMVPASASSGTIDSESSYCCTRRGDVDHSGDSLNISDLVFLIDYMFTGGAPPPCFEEADVNGDGADQADISDLMYLIDYMFTGGPAPVDCGLFLHGGQVTPINGDVDDIYTWEIVFRDTSGLVPSAAEVIIDDVTHQMALVSGAVATGATYRYESTLAEGSHRYSFRFVGAGDTELESPFSGYVPKPIVMPVGPEVADEVVIMDSQDVNLAGIDDSSLTFTYDTEAPVIQNGDILVGTDSLGYLRRVVSVTSGRGAIEVRTTDVSLSEAISNVSLDTMVTLNSETEPKLPGRGSWPWVEGFDGNVDLSANLSVSYDLGFDVGFVIGLGQLERFWAYADGQVTYEASITLTIEGEWSADPYTKTLWVSAPKVFYTQIGPFPLIWLVTVSLEGEFKPDASAHAVATYGVAGEIHGGIGTEWNDGVWKDTVWWGNSFAPSSPSGWPTFNHDVGLEVNARLAVKPRVTARLWGTVGPYLEAGPYGRFHGQVMDESPWCQWGLYWGVLAGLGVDLGPLDDEAGKRTGERIWENEWELWETTIVERDCAAPWVTATSPVTGATGVSVGSVISAKFSEDMDPATINAGSFTVDNGVTGAVAYNSADSTATFYPDADFAEGTTYTATVAADVTDEGGTPMDAAHTWSFTTVSSDTFWQPVFMSEGPMAKACTCATHTGCTSCPDADDVYFFDTNYQIGFPPFHITQTGNQISGSLTNLYGDVGTFETMEVTANLTGTVYTDHTDWTLTLTGWADYLPNWYLFDTYIPFQCTFAVTNATMQNGDLVGHFVSSFNIVTPPTNCVDFRYHETNEGTAIVDITGGTVRIEPVTDPDASEPNVIMYRQK